MSSVIILLTLSVNSKHDKSKLVISPVSCTANLPVGLQVKSSDGYTREDFIASSCSCSTCSISNATTTLVRLTGPIAPIILITCLYALMYLIQHSFNQLPTPRGHSLKISKPYCKTVMRKFFFSYKVINRWNSLPEEAVQVDFMALSNFSPTRGFDFAC